MAAFKHAQGNMLEINERIGFDPNIKKFFATGENKAICHAVSLDCILNMLKCVFNNFDLEKYMFQATDLLKDIGRAIFCCDNDNNIENSYMEYYESITSSLNESKGCFITSLETQIKNYFNYLKELESKLGKVTVLDVANKIAEMLNNALSNLRVGDSHFNKSISYSYDPREICDDNDYILFGKCDSKQIKKIKDIFENLKYYYFCIFNYPFGIDIYKDKNNIVVFSSTYSDDFSSFKYKKPIQLNKDQFDFGENGEHFKIKKWL